MNRSIGLLVSGHCEVVAVPILIRRLLHERLRVYDVQPDSRPIRKPEGQLLQQGSRVLEDTIERLRRRHDGVLVMVDLEDDDYQRFICVETTNAADDVIGVAPGGEFRLVADYRVMHS